MVTRDDQVDRIAGIISQWGYYDGDPTIAERAADANREGWEFDTGGHGLNTWIRHTGVILSDAELAEAVALGTLRFLRPEDTYTLADVRAGRYDAAIIAGI